MFHLSFPFTAYDKSISSPVSCQVSFTAKHEISLRLLLRNVIIDTSQNHNLQGPSISKRRETHSNSIHLLSNSIPLQLKLKSGISKHRRSHKHKTMPLAPAVSILLAISYSPNAQSASIIKSQNHGIC